MEGILPVLLSPMKSLMPVFQFENQPWPFLVISTVLVLRLWFKCTQVLSGTDGLHCHESTAKSMSSLRVCCCSSTARDTTGDPSWIAIHVPFNDTAIYTFGDTA